ncbi:MAG: hypothetical protein COB35_11255 [Gammaproteobacteria bacterium]|nr:MAG: hypothetical protein COB35_11255 [Gammaproteobacteria bacterium]
MKWLGLDLPRIPSIDGKRVGTQKIFSDESTLSWQCQALIEHSRSQVATVEASSRYCIIFSNLMKMTMAEFEQELKRRWLKEALIMAVESGAINNVDVNAMEKQFIYTTMKFSWFKNTDLSVNGHVADTEQWIRSGSVLHRINYLGEIEAFELAFHINKMRKKVKISTKKRLHQSFIPVARLLDDALFRFAQGLSADKYPNTDTGDFPSPYAHYQQKKQDKLVAHGVNEEKTSNVIYLEQYKGVKKLVINHPMKLPTKY